MVSYGVLKISVWCPCSIQALVFAEVFCLMFELGVMVEYFDVVGAFDEDDLDEVADQVWLS